MPSCRDYLSIWPADQQPIAAAVCMAESGDRLGAECLNCAGVAEDSVCWWQINLNAHPQYNRDELKSDPAACAHAAHDVWEGSGWDAWSTYTNGAYLRYVDGGAPPAAEPQPAAAGGAPTDGAAAVPRGLVLLGAAALVLWAIGGD